MENSVAQVEDYLTELVLESDPEQNNSALLHKWAKILSKQEKIAIARLSPISFLTYPHTSDWYVLQSGEYSVMEEPVLNEVFYDGQRQATITRNRYGCLVLNANNLLIVDVDIVVPRQSDNEDCASSCQVAISERQAISALQVLVEQFPQLSFRVYRTRNGLRYFCTTRKFDPTYNQTQRLMQNLYADPLYMCLCKFQATFRARLTPKPWRVEVDEAAARFVYDRITGIVLPEWRSYAVCHLIEIIGQQTTLPEFEKVIQIHDFFCRVDQLDLELV